MDSEPVTGDRLCSSARSPLLQYQQIDLASRIDGATPHALVEMLYAELSVALAVMQRAADAGDTPRRLRQHERASSILHALEAGLDHANGGTLATALTEVYRQMRRRLVAAREGDVIAIAEIREGVENLATAWARIRR